MRVYDYPVPPYDMDIYSALPPACLIKFCIGVTLAVYLGPMGGLFSGKISPSTKRVGKSASNAMIFAASARVTFALGRNVPSS